MTINNNFNLRRCQNCGAFVLDSYFYCPNCGTQLPPNTQPKKRRCPMCQGTGQVPDWGAPAMNK